MKRKAKTRAFTVIGIYPQSGQVCADYAQAEDGAHALRIVAEERGGGDTYCLIVALEGEITEGKQATYPGTYAQDTESYADGKDNESWNGE